MAVSPEEEKNNNSDDIQSEKQLSDQISTSDKQLAISTILNITNDLPKAMMEENKVKVESLFIGRTCEIIEDKIEDDYLFKEKWYTITLQVCIPFLIAGIGTIAAGIVLGNVQELKVFQEVKALYILVPAIIGLKGNLDMCLASRLSTQAHLGTMDSKKELLKMIIGNLTLVQIQAIIAACLVAIFAVSVSALVNGGFDWGHSLLLCISSVLTATVSCLILDLVLISVIITSYHFKLNPDNLATPLAASIGDVVSLTILSFWANLFYGIEDNLYYVLLIILGVYILIILPILILIVRKNKYTSKVLTHGWTPVIAALIISGCGGLVLDTAVDQFNGFTVFQPIINGIGGNLVSVQASRIATMLHKTSIRGVIPVHTKKWVWPWKALIYGVFPAKSARILILISIPGQIFFVLMADLIYNGGVLCAHVPFVLCYLSVSLIQIMILLYIAHIMIHILWSLKIDPDSAAIPYLTALGDLIGSCLLLLAFTFLRYINEEYTPVRLVM